METLPTGLSPRYEDLESILPLGECYPQHLLQARWKMTSHPAFSPNGKSAEALQACASPAQYAQCTDGVFLLGQEKVMPLKQSYGKSPKEKNEFPHLTPNDYLFLR